MVPASVRRQARALGALLALAAVAVVGWALIHHSAGRPLADARAAPQPMLGARAFPPAPRLPATCSETVSMRDELTEAYADADGGETICLASGRYGAFTGGAKPERVGIRAARGADVTIDLDLDNTVNLQIEGVTIPHTLIDGASRNITIADSRFTGLAVVHADQMANAHIRFDHNVHANVDTCTSCYQGRLHVDGTSGRPSGVVITNSLFSGGDSDGVRADGDGVQILGNEFTGLRDHDPFHTDPIQIYGGRRAVIRGNWFHGNAVSAEIMMADGGDHNVVEDNLVTGAGYTWAMTWYGDDGSVIRHNTFVNGSCSFHVRCGIINVGAKTGTPAGHGTVIRDNVLTGISNGGGGERSTFTADHNLTATAIPGSGNVVGNAVFRDPAGTYAGHRLARGSTGTGRASDGLDPGIR